jgi:hypothetical protein
MQTRRVLLVFVCALFACVGHPTFAQSASASNPQATLSIVGDAVVRLAPDATTDDLFGVRIVDAQGAPIHGIIVQFFPDGCLPFPLQPDTCPPPEVYGHFTDQSVADSVITDSDGKAAAPEYVGGSVAGLYYVAACVWVAFVPQNAIIGSALCVDLRVQQIAIGTTVPITSAFTGAWYDPNQSGHGIMLEVLSDNRLLAYWFSFDPDGYSQVWFGGVGAIDNDLAIVGVDMSRGGRWIPNFDPSQFSLLSWGSLMFQFSDCNHGRVDFTADNSFTSYGSGHMDLTRLTMPAGLACD